MPELRAVDATVRGIVQGVGFRAATVRKARQLSVIGWCRNEADGSVRVFAQGDSDRVDRLIEWLRHGPRAAVVREVVTEDVAPRSQLSDFAVH